MKLSRRLVAAIAVPALAVLGAGLGYAGAAHAGVGPVSYTPAGADSISGYYAHALNDGVNFTHITSYVGSDGHHTIEQLPVSASTVQGAAGIALCNQQTGNAAQVGLVNAGGGLVNVVWATGQFQASHPNNDDQCQGGIVNPDELNVAGLRFGVLKAGIPDNNTVSLDILYDFAHAFSYRGHHYAAGTIVFSATNLGAPGVSYTVSTLEFHHGLVFNEGDAGAVSDTRHVTTLSGTPLFPNPGCDGTLNCDPRLLEGFSHVALDGNRTNGGSEVFGSLQNGPAWTAFPVASSLDGQANGQVFLGPTVFSEDHFLELVGSPVS